MSHHRDLNYPLRRQRQMCIRDRFNSMYNSFAVNTRIARSNDAARRYQIAGTPAVVVDGKYLVEGEDAKVPQVVSFLVNKARAERNGK